MAFSDARNERDRQETGKNSTNHGGGDAKAAEGRNRAAMDAARSRGTMSSTAADAHMALSKYGVTPGAYMKEVDDYSKRVRDALNTDNTSLENAGNTLASLIGFNEQTPTQVGFNPKAPSGTRANWGFDPMGLVGSLAGGAFGVPLTGVLADQLSAMLGRPFEMNMGPQVFGGPSSPPAAPAAPGMQTASGQTSGGVPPQGGTGMNPGAGLGLQPGRDPRQPAVLPQRPPNPAPAGPGAMPAPAAAAMPLVSTPYNRALPNPGQVRLPPPPNYFMSQMT